MGSGRCGRTTNYTCHPPPSHSPALSHLPPHKSRVFWLFCSIALHVPDLFAIAMCKSSNALPRYGLGETYVEPELGSNVDRLCELSSSSSLEDEFITIVPNHLIETCMPTIVTINSDSDVDGLHTMKEGKIKHCLTFAFSLINSIFSSLIIILSAM